ncbi:SseB family protein [Pseudolysinimonas sp.]|uniref:SseB family protein n=1 Tax=Pseudolysinimonas sp. TaxID=2680009 RepID=UPI003F7DF787
MSPAADSAGVPFEGRRFHENPGAGDDGSASPRVLEAIRRFRAREVGGPEVVEALHDSRFLVPLVAVRGDEGVGVHGQIVDKTQELSMVTVEGPDGRPVLPAFTSVAAMQAWDGGARPIPIEAPRVALAAAAEGTPLVVVDPGSETEFAVRRTALRALATGERWTPSFEDAAVLSAFQASVEPHPEIVAVGLGPGDPDARLHGPELMVGLGVRPGLDPDGLGVIMRELQARWAADPVIAERVDSIGVRVHPS